MKTDLALAKSSLKAAKSGWYRYLATLWILILLLVIDLLTDQQFLSDRGEISFFNLDVPRIAFSFTYSVLFGIFAIWAASSAKTTLEILDPLAGKDSFKALSISAEYRLWGLSPLNRSNLHRLAFWLFSAAGLLGLAGVSAIHLGIFIEPDPGTMSPELYQGIGFFSAAILALSVYLTLTSIYPAWKRIYGLFCDTEIQ